MSAGVRLGGPAADVVFVESSDDDEQATTSAAAGGPRARQQRPKRGRLSDPTRTIMPRVRARRPPAPSQERAVPTEVVDLTDYPDDDVPLAGRKAAAVLRQLKQSAGVPRMPTFDVVETPVVAPKPDAKCPICLETIKDLACGPCGHVFCDGCLRDCIKSQKKCPTCRKGMQLKQIHRVYLNME